MQHHFFFRLDKLTHDPVDEQTVFEVRLSTVIIAAHRSRRCGYPHLYWANVEVLEEDQCIASRKESHIVGCCGQSMFSPMLDRFHLCWTNVEGLEKRITFLVRIGHLCWCNIEREGEPSPTLLVQY